MQYSKLPCELKELVRHMISVYMHTNDGLISRSDVTNILDAVSVLAEPSVSGSVGEMKVDPAKPESEETALQYSLSNGNKPAYVTPEIPEEGKFSDDAIDALLFALFGAGLTQAAESVVDQVETVKPRWKVTATSGDITLWVNVDQPQKYIAVGRGKKLGFELPEGGNLPPAELVAHMLGMFGEDVA
nr:MAG: hypothetical protein [Bacteriophage sp.]